MSYKAILVHVDDSKRNDDRVRIAAEFAQQFGAHLHGVADTGAARVIDLSANINGVDPALLVQLGDLRERALANIAHFKQLAEQLSVTSFEGSISQVDAVDSIARCARYCDLVVLGQTDPDEMLASTLTDFPEYMILHSGRPVLIVPYVGTFSQIGRRPLLAWDGSQAAMRAVADALPLLQAAENVAVVIINPQKGSHGDQPGAELATYLARHGVRTDITLHRSQLDTCNALLSLAADRDSTMIVMGGYGHSRLRELIMGGTTRSMLQSMTVPVFMSH